MYEAYVIAAVRAVRTPYSATVLGETNAAGAGLASGCMAWLMSSSLDDSLVLKLYIVPLTSPCESQIPMSNTNRATVGSTKTASRIMREA